MIQKQLTMTDVPKLYKIKIDNEFLNHSSVVTSDIMNRTILLVCIVPIASTLIEPFAKST